MNGPALLRGDARALPLPDQSVDLICTSPPYLSLRDYGYDGQIGSEDSPGAYLDALIEATAEMARVLKPSGSIWLNLGDAYAPGKSLRLLPHRYAIRCVDELDLICRQDQVWEKANGLPESVTDRTRRSHEYFFHLTKSPRYYSAVDEIREPLTGEFLSSGVRNPRYKSGGLLPGETAGRQSSTIGNDGDNNRRHDWVPRVNPLGKLPGSVWTVATQPLRVPAELEVDHFAAMPMEWPRRLITGWCPREVCTACGEGRRPVSEQGEWEPTQPSHAKGNGYVMPRHNPTAKHGYGASTLGWKRDRTVTGYACACPDTTAPATPGVCLDPFGGTATTALVAHMLGRVGISVDLSTDYQRIARWRCNDPKERARAAGLDPDQVAKVTVPVAGQADLFASLDEEQSA